MHLPQELIEEILGYLSFDDEDQRSLRNCSLVAKSWINPSRKHIFESIYITQATRRSWLDKISPSNTELLRYVRAILFCGSSGRERASSGKPGIDDLYVYFPSFHRLRTIDLIDVRISYDFPEQIGMFSSCQQTLTSIILSAVSFRWHSFIALIDYFPNLSHLETQSLSFEDINRNPPPLSRPLRGRLCFHICEQEYLAALSNWFTGLDVEYEELTIDVGYVSGAYSQRIIATCAKALRRLEFGLLGVSTSLRRCSELRELEFSVLYPTQMHMTTISSVTSTHIRKITFSSYNSAPPLHTFVNNPCWVRFDSCISELAGKLRKSGNKQTLEVVFLVYPISGPSADYKGFLPKSREKVLIKIVERSSGLVTELS